MAFEARFTLDSLLVDHGVVSSWSAESRRAIAHESGSPIGFLNVATDDLRARLARKICCVAAPGVPGIYNRSRAHFNTYP
jgi:hypothetical protein